MEDKQVHVPREALRISVRGLVEFSHFPPDILPPSSLAMELGRQAHLARQQEAGGQAEVALTWAGEAQGFNFVISGRMDRFDEAAKPPLIEEIKLAPQTLPQQAAPQHLFQAACYGFMLYQQEGLETVCLKVSYVDRAGQVACSFEEIWQQKQLQQAFYELLERYALFQARQRAHLDQRNQSIKSLPFPYPDYRPGQHEMAAQVYTAIQRKKRLFAQMPTGTGKSAAVLYPSLKALGEGISRQIFCLSARGTQQLAMQKEVARMQEGGLVIRALTLYAKEKVCPMEQIRCHPEHCQRARGHYVRQQAALEEAMDRADFGPEQVRNLSEKHQLCPFEFSLALCELADVVICDYNYALDPMVRLSRIFERPRGITLLIDEAHNLADRARDMLSGCLSSSQLRDFRRQSGKLFGRATPQYKAFTQLIALVESPSLSLDDDSLPEAIAKLLDALSQPFLPQAAALIRDLLAFLSARNRALEDLEDYQPLHQVQPRKALLEILNLNPAPYLQKATRGLSGCVYYSATLSPLGDMLSLLGGQAGEDACLALPSPFPAEHLLCLHLPINTRYQHRENSLLPLAQSILALYQARPCKMIAYFPSFAYLNKVREKLEEINPGLPLLPQQPAMDEGQRLDFLAAFTEETSPRLGLCVLGGVFSEGVDLPGQALLATAIVGVGLPQLSPQRDLFRDRMQISLGRGFAHAYQNPGMHKVVQAAGRLIRSQHDRGVLLLLDDRFSHGSTAALLPPHIRPLRVESIAEIDQRVRAFWQVNPEGG